MSKKKSTVSTGELASKFNVTRAAVAQWCRQGLIPGAEAEETPRGNIWHIPSAALKTFTPPKQGRPRLTAGEKKRPAKRAKR